MGFLTNFEYKYFLYLLPSYKMAAYLQERTISDVFISFVFATAAKRSDKLEFLWYLI